MSEGPIATAYVEIKPTPTSIKAFPRTVKTELDAALSKTTFKIPLTPVLGTFRARIQKELSSAKYPVTVTPVLHPEFRAKLQKLVASATAGLTVPINVVGTGTGTGRGGGGGGGGTRRTPEAIAAQQAERQMRARLAIQADFNKVMGETFSAEERLAAITRVYAASEEQIKNLTIEHTVAEEAKNTALVKVIEGEQTLQTALMGRITEEKLALDTTVKKQIAEQEAAAAAATRAEIETKSAAVRKELNAIDQIGLKYTGAVTIARQEAAAAEKLAQEAAQLHVAAIETRDTALIAQTKVLKENTAQEVIRRNQILESAMAERKAGAASASRAAKQEQLGRGGLATLLSRLGARGATLAAGGEFLAGAAIATALGKSVAAAASLEQELNVLRVTAGATSEEMVRVSARAKELGADITLPAVNANDAAQAMTELAKAGLTVQDSMDAARGTLQLATAAQLDNATAVNITASALNAFGLAGTEAVHVADLLAGAANAAQGGIGDMGGALSSVASVARQAGVSIEDTIALLTLLAKNGIQGSEAGTALRVALIRLIAPTSKAKEELKKLGVVVYDSLGNLRSDVFAQIAKGTEDMGAAQRNAALNIIFGTRAIRAQAVIGREGVTGLNAVRDATNQAGLAAELAGARTAGFSGKVEAFKNAAATLALDIGNSLIPALTGILDTGSEVTDVLQAAADAAKDLDGTLNQMGPIGPGGGGFGGGNIGATIFATGGDLIKESKATIELWTRFRDLNARQLLFQDPLETLKQMNREIIDATDNAGEFSKNLRSKEIASGYNEAAKYVRKLLEGLYGTSEETQKTRDYLEGVLRLMAALGRAPTAIELQAFIDKGFLPDELDSIQKKIDGFPPIDISANLRPQPLSPGEAKSLTKRSAQDVALAFAQSFGTELPPMLDKIITGDIFFFPEAAETGADKTAQVFADKLQGAVSLALATPGTIDDLIALRAERAERIRQRDRARRRFERTGLASDKALLDKHQAEVDALDQQIQSIVNDNKQKAKARADAIAKARNAADQAFLDALDFGRGTRENAILRAQASIGLSDDIKTHQALRDYLVKKRDEAAKTLKDAKTRAQAVQSLTRDIIQENQTIADLNRQLADSLSDRFQPRIDIASIVGTASQIKKLYDAWLKELQEAYDKAKKGSRVARTLRLQILQTQQDAFAAINESFELDISIAQATESQKKEIRARERYIEQLQKEQDQYKRGTLEWKRIQLAIIEQQNAIKEVRQAERDLFHEMSFEFLTRQQGFAATVMSNLLGNAVLTGSVGGVSRPTTGGRQTAADLARSFPGAEGFGGGLGEALILQREQKTGAGRGFGIGKGPSSVLQDRAAENAAGARGGTPSQFATIIHLLQRMVTLLSHQNERAKHPNNRHSRAAGGATMDTQ